MAKKKTGTPAPNQSDDDNDDDGSTASFTDEQRSEITNLVNAAVSGQLSRKLKGALSGALDEAMAPIREQLESLGTRRSARDDDGDDIDDEDPPQQQRGKGKRNGAAQRDPEFATMQKKLAKLEEERKVEREQAISREKDGMIRDHLQKIGVDPLRMRGAAAVIAGSIKRDEKTGSFSFTAKRDGYDDDLDVEAGIKEWASTDEGKSYLAPPKGQQQARGGAGTRVAPSNAPVLGGGRPMPDKAQAKSDRKQAALDTLGKAINELGGAAIPIGGS